MLDFLMVLYILLYIGMGITQPIAASIRLLAEKRFDSAYALGLKRYLFTVFVYFIILYGMVNYAPFIPDSILGIYTMILPWTLAIFYMHHVYSWRKKRKNIKAFDTEHALMAPNEDRLLLDTYPKKKVKIEASAKKNRWRSSPKGKPSFGNCPSSNFQNKRTY